MFFYCLKTLLITFLLLWFCWGFNNTTPIYHLITFSPIIFLILVYVSSYSILSFYPLLLSFSIPLLLVFLFQLYFSSFVFWISFLLSITFRIHSFLVDFALFFLVLWLIVRSVVGSVLLVLCFFYYILVDELYLLFLFFILLLLFLLLFLLFPFLLSLLVFLFFLHFCVIIHNIFISFLLIID